jgi:hypothetical protein
LSTDITNAKLSELFDHSGGWAQEMTASVRGPGQPSSFPWSTTAGRIRTRASLHSILLEATGRKEAGGH